MVNKSGVVIGEYELGGEEEYSVKSGEGQRLYRGGTKVDRVGGV